MDTVSGSFKSIGSAESDRLVKEVQLIGSEFEVAVTVTILDRRGIRLASRFVDGAIPASVGISERKARLALDMEQPTRELSREDVSDFGSGYSTFPGGVPLKMESDGLILGAIGVSGLTGDEDEAIAVGAMKEAGFYVPRGVKEREDPLKHF